MVQNYPGSVPIDSTESFNRLTDLLCQRYTDGRGKAPQVIFVIGAAASHWGGLPLWDSMKDAIIDRACALFPQFVEEARRKLAPVLGLPDDLVASNPTSLRNWIKTASIEAICSIACDTETVGDAIRDLLVEKFSGTRSTDEAGPRPQLAFELLAHLMKHKFVDHVINFNFDPLLDAALENELSPADYDLIVSDHQGLKNGTQDIARIVKLHGTVRAPQTLRFALRDTELLTPGMIQLLDRMLRSSGPGQKTHLVSLGYSWRDPGFCHWVLSRASYLDGITIVRRTKQLPDFRVIAGQAEIPPLYLISTDEIKAKGVSYLSIDYLLWALWDTIHSRLDSSDASGTAPNHRRVFVMPASRHILLGYWFGPNLGRDPTAICPKTVRDPLNPHSVENRFEAELLLHLVKCKGMINLRVMARDCRLNGIRGHLKGKHVLDKKDYICRNTYAGVNETYFAVARTLDDLCRLLRGKLASSELLVPVFENGNVDLKLRTADDFFDQHVKTIFRAPEIEVVQDSAPSTHWLFVGARSLPTLSDFKRASLGLIQRDWTHLLAVAETGEWLTADDVFDSLQQKRGSLLVIRVSLDSLDQWRLGRTQVNEARDRLTAINGLNCSWGELSWWQHNRHLTLAYDEAQGRFVGGIYFRRRLKAHQVAPVEVWEPSDCVELFNTFLAYVDRSCEEAIRRIEQAQKAPATTVDHRRAIVLRVLDSLDCFLLVGRVIELARKIRQTRVSLAEDSDVHKAADDAMVALIASLTRRMKSVEESRLVGIAHDLSDRHCPTELRPRAEEVARRLASVAGLSTEA